MTYRLVKSCADCGAEMKPGERVRVTLSWEHPTMYMRHDGLPVPIVELLSRSKFVCKGCAEEIAGRIGVERPEEVE